jgi:hypothetical protein
MGLFLNRFFRALKLDVGLYQELLDDPKLFNQALIAVFIYSMAAAFGTFGRTGPAGNNIGMITTLLGWYVWAISTYFIGARIFPEEQTEPDRRAVMRVLGFACAPGVLRIVGFIPNLGITILAIATIWMLAAATVGVKLALNYQSTARALGVSLMGWIISAVFQGMMFVLLFSAFGVSVR